MFKKCIEDTFLFEEPSTTSRRVSVVLSGDVLEVFEREPSNSDWHFLQMRSGGLLEVEGWAPSADFEDVEPTLTPLEEEAFVRFCVEMETSSNAVRDLETYPLVADYIIALADIESGIANVASKYSDKERIGPFQLTTARWQRYLAATAALSSVPSRTNPYSHVPAAGALSQLDSEDLRKLHAGAGLSSDSDPFVPDYLDLFHVHLLGAEAAFICSRARAEQDTSDDWTRSMGEVLARTGLTDAATLDRFVEDGARFLKSGQDIARVREFTESTEKALDDALSRAFTLIEKHAPEFLVRPVGGAPWFAKAEAKLGKTEANDRAEIISYFKATDSGITRLAHWCGAFVAQCLKESGGDIEKSIVRGSAAAVSWLKWGNTSLPVRSPTPPPQGAVVVLSPSPGTATTGHVGFFHSRTDTHVSLLGGNQDDSVKVSKYPLSRVREIRWQDFGGAPDSGTGVLAGIPASALHALFDNTARVRTNIDKHWPAVRDGLTGDSLDDRVMLAMAMGTIRAETAGFEPIDEGQSRHNTRSSPFDRYEPGTSKGNRLGNTVTGDGPRFKGRGFIQLTGRFNYTNIGRQLGVPLAEDPTLANDPAIAGRVLARFLKNKEGQIRSALAAGDLAAARKLVNGGSHGLPEFTGAYNACRSKFG